MSAQAAFYDVDGTLLSANVVHVYARYALSAPGLLDRAGRLGRLVASLPRFALADRRGRKHFNDLFYEEYRGLSEDRLYVLGEEICEKLLRPRLFPEMLSLIERSRQGGCRQILVTGALDTVTGPLARAIGVDDWVANRLELRDHVATGALQPPVLAGPEKARWLQQYAEEERLDLRHCRAYADSASDIPMLCAVGHPTAVNPDRQLQATAEAHNWPIMWVGGARPR